MSNCNCSDSCTIDKKPQQRDHFLKKYVPAIISFVLLIAGIILNRTETQWFANRWINIAWFIGAYIPVGFPVLKEAWESLRNGAVFNEFMLMGIATIGAFYIGEYPEGVAVMLFYAVGELFQNNAVNKAKRNISALLDVRPETADVVRNNGVESINPERVEVGETIEVKVGGRIPLDGIMESETASFNTAALTGESVPRTIHRGEEVLAGMIVTNKVTRIKVTKPFGQSALARILQLVEDATERKAPAEHFIRKFAKVYTPIVVGLAFFIVLAPYLYSFILPSFNYTFNDWLYRGLVFLVISCPCALVISIPLGYFGGIGLASRNGILFKGSNYLDAITKVSTVVMDKTGTLTQGVFKVQKVISEGIDETDLVKTIASIESQSTHPIAKAVVEYAKSQNISISQVTDVTEIPGYGLSATVDRKTVFAGNAKLLKKYIIEYPAEIAAIQETIVLCAIDGRYVGYVLVADAPKEDTPKAISGLHALGIGTVILSGDKQAIVSKLAAELGIVRAYGDLLPEGKVIHVEQIKKEALDKVAFVGDGINDAPVLALSDVGIAMGGLGSDVAIETADVIIQTDHPSKIVTAIRIGKMTRQIIIQNISLAFSVKIIVLILGAGGLATLWEAVFADVGVALLAILNATRLLHKKMV